LQGTQHLEREHRLPALGEAPVGLGDQALADPDDPAGDLLRERRCHADGHGEAVYTAMIAGATVAPASALA
jgi:hypothetical protein